jgi:hypothetical protein
MNITINNKLYLPLDKAKINELKLPSENSKKNASVLSIKKNAIKKIYNSMVILLRELSKNKARLYIFNIFLSYL